MVFSMRKSSRDELQIEDVNIKQLQKFKYLGKEDGKYDSKIRTNI